MTEKEYRGYIDLMQDSYRGSYPAEVVKRAWKEIGACSTKAMNAAIDTLLLNHTYLPSMQRVIDEALRAEKAVRSEAAVKREQESTKDKHLHQQAQANLARPGAQKTEIGKLTCTLVLGLASGRITRQTFLDGLLHLDKLYPAAGFATEANRIRMRYERQRFPLNQCARGGVI
jgi:hypothetical protein